MEFCKNIIIYLRCYNQERKIDICWASLFDMTTENKLACIFVKTIQIEIYQ